MFCFRGQDRAPSVLEYLTQPVEGLLVLGGCDQVDVLIGIGSQIEKHCLSVVELGVIVAVSHHAERGFELGEDRLFPRQTGIFEQGLEARSLQFLVD